MRRRLIAGALCLGAVLAVPAAAAPADDVTMKVQRLPDGRGRFSGTIPSGAANEYVAITEEKCGASFATVMRRPPSTG